MPECTGGSDCADTHSLVMKENKTDLFLIKVFQTLAYSELYNDIFQCFANIKLLVICENVFIGQVSKCFVFQRQSMVQDQDLLIQLKVRISSQCVSPTVPHCIA